MGITRNRGSTEVERATFPMQIRWVLGEQKVPSGCIRKYADVIFSGTETRKPLGFASVAITLDNSDHKLPIEYEEVTVTRRLYHSGESNIC